MTGIPLVQRAVIEPAIGYAGRLDRVRSRLAAEHGDVGGVLVTDPADIRWCTGFSGSTSWLAVLADGAVLGTDHRYAERAAAELAAAGVDADIEIHAGRTRAEQRREMAARFAGLEVVGAQARHLSHAEWTELAADLPLRAVDGLVAAERRVKDAGEVARIESACRYADAALGEVAPLLASGLTEADVRDELEYRMRRFGADGPSYDTIVASGPEHAARPHHGAERRTIVEGDWVVIDVGALVDGYHSDMTRSFVVGEPDERQLALYALVLEAQLAGLAAVAPGTPSRDVDRACREVFDRAGYGDWFVHASGHGVGLAIHEDPFHADTSTLDLVLGDVVTVEPGLYRAGVGGVRVEDLVVVTETGCRILTHSPKDDPCLPSPPTI